MIHKPQTTTPVIFRKFSDTGDIIALFPTLPGGIDSSTCLSYMRSGQHAAACVSLVYDSAPIKGFEHLPLLKELEQQGYGNLRVYRRYQSEFTAQRLNALRREVSCA